MRADKARKDERRGERATAPAAPTPAGAAAERGGRRRSVETLLEIVREQLGADLAYISTFAGEERRYRTLVSPYPLPIAEGHSEPRAGTLCQRMVDGEVPSVIPDTAAATFDVSRARGQFGIGSYVGVPLHRGDGQLYGTLCTVSLRADPGLRDRDAGVLRAISRAVMDLVEEEELAESHHHGVLARLAQLRSTGGPRIVYQPVVDLGSLRHAGVEALSRFPAGTPTPDRWFAEAAAAGAGVELELHAIGNALAALDVLPGFLTANASPATVVSPGFARLLADRPLDRLVVEITEHEAIDDYRGLVRALAPLRARGLRTAVDDTGAGYASMRHVLQLVPDLLKLDISLVRGIDAAAGQRALTAALVTFAAETGAAVVAEGVETPAELACLRGLGIGYAQGYLLARPAPLADLLAQDPAEQPTQQPTQQRAQAG